MTQNEIDTLKHKEALLMNRWQEQWHQNHADYAWFNADGIVDYDRWCTLPEGKHILVLLKETNGLKSSLADFLRNGGSQTYWRTWNNVARWVNLILNGTYWEYVEKSALDDMVRNIAAVNLKKYAGGSRANRKKIITEASKDISLLHDQITLYEPDIILTGGWGLVSDFLHDQIYQDHANWVQPTEQAALWYYETSAITSKHKTLVISMPHPNRSAKRWTLELDKALCLSGWKDTELARIEKQN